MLHLITDQNRDGHLDLLRSMYRDRKRVFVDILGWQLNHEDGEERDSFDAGGAHYLILQDPETRHHVASLRILATDRPHLLDTLFSGLCDGPIPRGSSVREITRLCLPFRRPVAERVAARNRLARAIIDYAWTYGVERYTAVCHMEFATQLLAAGWRCDMLGVPRLLSGRQACALQIQIDRDSPEMLKPDWRIDPRGQDDVTAYAA